MRTYDVIMTVTRGITLVDEIVLYPGLLSFATAEMLVERANDNPHAQHLAFELGRLYPKAIITTRFRINN